MHHLYLLKSGPDCHISSMPNFITFIIHNYYDLAKFTQLAHLFFEVLISLFGLIQIDCKCNTRHMHKLRRPYILVMSIQPSINYQFLHIILLYTYSYDCFIKIFNMCVKLVIKSVRLCHIVSKIRLCSVLILR